MFARNLLLTAALVTAAACSPAPVVKDIATTPAPDMAKWAATCEAFDEWDKPGPPYHIYGGTYYVGTCGISAILIAGESEHILIDSGTEAGADIVLANVAALGFSPEDIGLILQSHEHFDHIGGLAKIQQATGAQIAASQAAGLVIASGKSSPDDPQAGGLKDFPAAHVGMAVKNGQKINFGNNVLTAMATPGHTAGALSWAWQECEEGSCKTIVYADSMSPISNDTYRFGDHPALLAEYRAGIARIAGTKCGILLTPHPSASQMETRLVDGSRLIDPSACRSYAASITKRLGDRLAKEAANVK